MTSWKMETGHLVCRWSEIESHTPYNPRWMQEAADAHGSYLPPITDFASHSPFAGLSWWFINTAPIDRRT